MDAKIIPKGMKTCLSDSECVIGYLILKIDISAFKGLPLANRFVHFLLLLVSGLNSIHRQDSHNVILFRDIGTMRNKFQG